MAHQDLGNEGGEDVSEAEELLQELLPGREPSPDPRGAGMADDATVIVGPGTASTEAAPPRWTATESTPVGLDPKPRRRGVVWLAAALVLLALVAGAFLLGRAVGDGDETATGEQDEPASPTTAGADESDGGSGSDGGTATDTDADTATDTDGADDSTDQDPAAATGGTALSLKLEDYQFTIDGVVPSEEMKAAIEERMGLVFADFGSSTIAVDPAAPVPQWAEAAPSVINAMVLLHEGTIDITGEGTSVSGRGLQRDFDTLATRLSADLGFPPFSIGSSDVIEKPAPWVRAVATGDGTVTMTGELADETMRSTIVDGAKEIYGEANVTDETMVNPERHDRFLIMRFPSNLAAYRVFGEFDIKGENEAFTAVLMSGLVFDTLETELTAESQERLKAIMFTLTRNPLPVAVIGHTDDVGSEADNQALSEARAESVARFLQSNGVQPDLITTEGRGEAEPVADNSTDEGRALNRRVEITVGLE